jgi:hypothetical protein
MEDKAAAIKLLTEQQEKENFNDNNPLMPFLFA